MRSRNLGIAGGILAAAALVTPAPRPATADTMSSPVFQVTDLGIAETKGITNTGQVYGTSNGQSFTTQPLLAGTSTVSDLGSGRDPKTTVGGLGTGYNVAYGVNAAGQVVGQYQVTNSDGTFLRPYIQTSGNTTQIPTLGGQYGGALGVNASGLTVGSSQTADGNEHGYIYSPVNRRRHRRRHLRRQEQRRPRHQRRRPGRRLRPDDRRRLPCVRPVQRPANRPGNPRRPELLGLRHQCLRPGRRCLADGQRRDPRLRHRERPAQGPRHARQQQLRLRHQLRRPGRRLEHRCQ